PSRRQRALLLGVRSLLAGLRLGGFPLLPGVDLVFELASGQLVTPLAERPLGELHDVALVHQGDALAMILKRVVDRSAHEPLRSILGNRFDADRARFGETDFLVVLGKMLLEQADQSARAI